MTNRTTPVLGELPNHSGVQDSGRFVLPINNEEINVDLTAVVSHVRRTTFMRGQRSNDIPPKIRHSVWVPLPRSISGHELRNPVVTGILVIGSVIRITRCTRNWAQKLTHLRVVTSGHREKQL